MGSCILDSSDPGCELAAGPCEHSKEYLGFIKGGEFIS
jgi:hypothetical protein